MKKQWVHYQNKKREESSDLMKINSVRDILATMGYNAFQDQVIKSNEFLIEKFTRHPDLLLLLHGYEVPIELDGPIHGSGDEASESWQTSRRNCNYYLNKNPFIILNEEWLVSKKIDAKNYLQCVLFNEQQRLRARKKVETGE